MEPRTVTAGQGWQWIVDGYLLFSRNALVWITITILMGILMILSMTLPTVGPLLFNLMLPVLSGGLMLGCRATEEGKELEIVHLIAAFRTHATPLVTVGGVQLVGTMLILMAVMATASGATALTMGAKPPDMETMMTTIRSMAVPIILGSALYVLLMMLLWYAPVLVVFRNIAPVPAMKLSFDACWRNMMPFTVYGLALGVLWLIASIPLLLGLVVLIPVITCSIYVSYKDIFQENVRIDAPMS